MEHDYYSEYSMGDLRKQFPEIVSEADFMVSTILECTFGLFSEKLRENPESLGITDVNFDPQLSNSCTIAINSKMISIGCAQGYDPGAEYGAPSWYMVRAIVCRGGESEVKIFFEILNKFIAEISYKKLHRMAIERTQKDHHRLKGS